MHGTSSGIADEAIIKCWSFACADMVSVTQGIEARKSDTSLLVLFVHAKEDTCLLGHKILCVLMQSKKEIDKRKSSAKRERER